MAEPAVASENPDASRLNAVQSSPAARLQTPRAKLPRRALSLTRRIWRGGVRDRWQALRAPVLLGIGVSSLILGTIGYLQLTSVKPRYGLLDALYRAMTLFVFGGAAVPPVPTTLQIARIAAPLLTGYAAIGTVLALTREQAKVVAIRMFVRQHIVIAGLGGTGRRLAAALVDHQPVVVIESDPTSEHLAGARLRGVRTLCGNAADPKVLHQAGIQHAHSLVVVCGAGDTNVNVAAAATRSLGAGGGSLTIFVHLDNLDLRSSLAAEGATFESQRREVRLEYFNVMATAAQLLMEREPPFAHDQDAGSEHFLIVGLEGFGEQLILQLARLWISHGPRRATKLRVTLTGPSCEDDIADLLIRYPALDRYLKLEARPLAIESAAFLAGDAMAGPDGVCDITHAYVTLADEADGLVCALALHARPDAAGVPVTVAVADDHAGVSVILGSDRGRLGAIAPFGVLSEATNSNLLLRGTNELLARSQHSQWLRQEQAAGRGSQDNPNWRPWEDLNEEQREINRRFADDVPAKLALVHCLIVPMPLPDPDQEPFRFTAEELETLAQHEHVRWMKTMAAAGWRFGVPRDNSRRIHDQIKPWEQLDEANRDKDRDAVREIPPMLAVAGFAIRRRDGPPGSS